jgi:thiosulfate dehydrogenase [quinone] large subunit
MFDQRTLTYQHQEYLTEQPDAAVRSYREAAFALLRVAFGVVFLVSGLSKLMAGFGSFEAGLQKQFEGKLPAILLKPFGYALPVAELVVGVLIVLGLFSVFALVVSGFELIALVFGMAVAGEFPVVAHNLQYAFVNFVLLWFAAYNGFSVDRLIRRSRSR